MIKIAEHALECLNTIESAGYEAYIVGGAVRDLLMGLAVSDYDITTNASPEDIISLFPRTHKTGIKHGTVTVITDTAPIEVTTFRGESGYSDSRHPDSVRFISSINEDLARRDFTINAIAYNPRTDIIDRFGGIDDIKNGILRAVGEPERRFKEDALRIMRLFRFACRLDFAIDPATYSAAANCASSLSAISAERIFAELCGSLVSSFPQNIAPLIRAGGLSHLGVSDITSPEKLSLISPSRNLRIAAFMLLAGADIDFLKKLKSDNALINFVREIFSFLEYELCCDDYSARLTLSRFSDEIVFGGLELKKIILGEDISKAKALIERAIKLNFPRHINDLAVCGNDIAALGYAGKQIGEQLEFLLQQVLKDPELNNRASLLALSEQILENAIE